MKRLTRASLGAGLILGAILALSGCGGGGTVYVGVGVPGPWVGPRYPGYYPPPTMGPRPPCCWDEDAQDDAQDELQDADPLDPLLLPVPLLEWIGVPDPDSEASPPT